MSLDPATIKLSAWKGHTFSKLLVFYADEDSTELMNLTGYAASMKIVDAQTGEPLHTLSTGDGGIALGGVEGTIRLRIPHTVTATFPWQTARYYLTTTSPVDDVELIARGPFTLRTP